MSGATDALAAGRELDALVAERAMGYYREGKYLLSPDPYVGRVGAWVGNHFSVYGDALPAFSTDIAAAWQVVRVLQASNPGWRFSLLGGDSGFGGVFCGGGWRTDRTQRERFGWVAEFFGHEDPEQDYGQRHASECADTAPLAICRAALTAITGGAS